MMRRDLRIERYFPHHPLERVWRALTDPAALAEWNMQNDFQPRLGHRFQFRDKPQGGWDGIVDCEVLELEPPRVLAFSWRSNKLDSKVRFTLEPLRGGTLLRLEHTGFQGLRSVLISVFLGSGWKKMLDHKLSALLVRLADPSYRPTGAREACH